ncbi:Os12g0106801 [Oryza sativa Japonica Group]|uniref:Os12g0106801 protein n=1 Tax=Oryza sativa subsp. japonica TaxID=39947 RepID=A0A0P0Y625_ORYSJ|nr:hypothetical protein EE612_057332 [Oryza sativa]BAT15509.1 Os12g0106801 [Oryza sativa Japonica Group]
MARSAARSAGDGGSSSLLLPRTALLLRRGFLSPLLTSWRRSRGRGRGGGGGRDGGGATDSPRPDELGGVARSSPAWSGMARSSAR